MAKHDGEPPKSADARLWTRLQNAAEADNVSLAQMGQWSDVQILRAPNLGLKSLRVLRSVYPRHRQPLPVGADRAALIDTLERIVVDAHAALKMLKGEGR